MRLARKLCILRKEIDYCEIHLEKERRLRRQATFLERELETLRRNEARHTERGPGVFERGALLEGSPAIEAREAPRRLDRKEFVAHGVAPTVSEEREIVEGELATIRTRLENFAGFKKKRLALEEERRRLLGRSPTAIAGRTRRFDQTLKKVESQWIVLTEDLANLEEAVPFLDRNLDYLKSCRSFITSARSGFDIEAWMACGHLSEVFCHSALGRAQEMAAGADRNLRSARKELVCVTTTRVPLESFRPLLVRLLELLHEDLYDGERLHSSVVHVNKALQVHGQALERLKSLREGLYARLARIEKSRAQILAQQYDARSNRLLIEQD